MTKYEIMYIIRPDLKDEAKKDLISNFNKVITDRDSEVVEVVEWGMRDLAYEINDFKRGHYVILRINATTEAINEFDRLVSLGDDIIRYIITNDEE